MRTAAALVALLAACGGGGASTRPADPADLRRAVSLLGEQKHSEAAAILAKLAVAAPDDPDPLGLLGSAQLELHRPADAKLTFERLKALRPDDVRAEIGLARALELLGELDAADAALGRALAREPNRTDALYAAGQLAVRRNLDARARELLTKALSLEPWSDASAAAHYALSGIAGRAGRGDEARAERALYERKFEWSTRRTALERRLSAVPQDAKAARSLAALYAEAGNGRAAASLLEPLARAYPREATLRAELADALALAGDRAGARRADAEALAVDAGCVAALRSLAQLDLDEGKLADSLERLSKALDLDPSASAEPRLRAVAAALEERAQRAGETKVAEAASEIRRRLGS